MRMIDADALLTEIRKKEAEPNYQHTGEDWCVGLIIAEGLVDEQPTIEPPQRCIATIVFNEEDLEKIVKERVEEIKELLPRKGKWIGYKADDKDWQRDDGSPIFMNCSECHEAVINNGSAHWNFCPNCGADMGGENE